MIRLRHSRSSPRVADGSDSNAEKELVKEADNSSVFSIDNVLWLVASMILFYFTDFARVVLYDRRVDRFWLNIGLALLTVNLSIAAYFIVWLTYIKKIPSTSWETQNPTAIPVATVAFVSASFCFILGLWPVWSILTIPILFVLFMGFIVIVAMLPEW